MSKYILVKPQQNSSKFTVTLVADSNDGDYVTTITDYAKRTFDTFVIDDLVDLINNHSGEYQLEDFEGKHERLDIPYGDNGSCHTLVSFSVSFLDEDGFTWDVEIK